MLLNDLITYEVPVQKIRLGTPWDGGYVIVPSMKYDILISAGISTNVDFENDFLRLNSIPCYAFDGTIQGLPSTSNSGIQWIKKNIGSRNTETQTNLHEYLDTHKDIFLKMDIEGAEFDWMNSCSEEQLHHLKQIVIEVHWPNNTEKWASVYSRLAKTHWLVHVHGNNHCGCYNVEGVNVPEVLELTYIRKKDWPQLHRNRRPFPHEEVDRRNYDKNEQIELRGFPFVSTDSS
jgi:hypothetical protein